MSATKWEAPIPPPAILAGYDQIVAGGANRIIKMAEKALNHQIQTETTVVDANISDVKRGQWLGAWIAALAISGATITAILEAHWIVSVALVGVPLFAAIKALIDSRSSPQ